MDDHRLRTWIDWYRFARREFEYTHGEAVLYANLRSVEEQNRQRLGRSSGPLK
jgi:hypothetical protein